MKMSRVCSGMLSSGDDDFKFLKILKNCKKYIMHVHHPGVMKLFYLSKPACP